MASDLRHAEHERAEVRDGETSYALVGQGLNGVAPPPSLRAVQDLKGRLNGLAVL